MQIARSMKGLVSESEKVGRADKNQRIKIRERSALS